MSIVQPRLPHARVLDLFAGSGALGLEALSRGADSAEFVDTDASNIAVLRENVAQLGAESRVVITIGDALDFVVSLEPGAFDIAFADPPYAGGAAVRLAACWQACPFAALLGIEHATGAAMPVGGDTRRYGGSSVTFYR